MKVISILKSAFKSILSNKLRSSLTMLGLIIGIASVIVLVGIGNGASTNVRSQVQLLGADIITISINSDDTSFEYDDLDEFKTLDNIESIAPYKRLSATVTRNTTSTSNSSLMAINNNYLDITNTSGKIKNCYNIGQLKGTSGVGGIIGNNENSSTATNSYYLPKTATSDYGNISENNYAKDKEFITTNFVNIANQDGLIWKVVTGENNGYPVLIKTEE